MKSRWLAAAIACLSQTLVTSYTFWGVRTADEIRGLLHPPSRPSRTPRP